MYKHVKVASEVSNLEETLELLGNQPCLSHTGYTPRTRKTIHVLIDSRSCVTHNTRCVYMVLYVLKINLHPCVTHNAHMWLHPASTY